MASPPSDSNPNPDALSFRKATVDDVPSVVSLVNSAYRGDSSRRGWTTEADFLDGQRTDQREVAELIEAENSMILLGELDRRPVASAHLESHEEGAYLGMLAVSPDFQGRGIGKRMMAEAEKIAQRHWGAKKMIMTVISLRADIIAFYERWGYVRTGRAKPFPTSVRFGIQKTPGLQLEYLEKPLA